MNPQILSSLRGPYASIFLSIATLFIFNRFYKYGIYSLERSVDLEFIYQNVHLWTLLLSALVIIMFFS